MPQTSHSLIRRASLALAGLALLAPLAQAQKLRTVQVVSGLSEPLFLTAPPGDTTRLFILEQNSGLIKIIKNGSLLATPFLNVGALASQGGERGLLGLAFHPDYASNGFFYINYTNNSGHTVVARYTVSAGDPDVADSGSAFTIITINQPYSNHNGGWLAFGPNDGYLYIGMGDGGDANDPQERAQNGQELLGKMLRLDVDGGSPYAIPGSNPFVGSAPLDEIWAFGTRNPWRCAFDRLTGDLYIADVGQGSWEEVSFQPGNSPGGENYGWDIMEGRHCHEPAVGCNQTGLVLPFYEYSHGGFPNFRCSITGGYVYRGSAIPGLQGTYFFADYCSGQIWSLRYDGTTMTDFRERTSELEPAVGAITGITSFGEDASGEIYIVDADGGEIWRIAPDLMTLSVPTLTGGSAATVSVSDATANQVVFFGYSLTGTGLTPVSQLNVTLGLDNPGLAGSDRADGQGNASLGAVVPPVLSGRTVWIQAAENGNTSNVVATTVL
ncbi:MAG: glucose dehydrogenase [Planctomycetota bacterium]|nr:MAG: glucose dehydrogenase [Planctomycetota bacterium]